LILITAFPACRRQANPAVYQESQQAFDAGLKASAEGRYEAAIEQLGAALEGGGLLPDSYSTALLERAICLARLGRFQEAHADLEIAAGGAAADEIHRARSFVFAKEGKTVESDSEFREARRLNPSIQRIVD
jgi:tetratricopeptide (TPR) repeat protein